jgi:hypothetical protein
MVPGAGKGSASIGITPQDSAIINLHGYFRINIHMCVDIAPREKISPMNINEIARVSKNFKSWSLTHNQRSNDDEPPGGATPIALAAPDGPLRTFARGTGQNR